MNAMILAAGRGERLRPITDTTPKALVKVRGERLLDRHLRMLAAAGINTVVINLGWLGEQIVNHVDSTNSHGLNIVFSPEYDHVLETGGGICRALPILGSDPFWVVNGDIYTDITLPSGGLDDDVDGHLVLVPTPIHKTSGDFDLRGSRVQFSATPSLTFSGVACYRPSFFDHCQVKAFSVAPMLYEAAKKGRLSGNLHDGMWEDIGTPERLKRIGDHICNSDSQL